MLIKFILKLKILVKNEIEYGFYTRSSIFQPPRKKELRFALGNRDYHIKFL